MSSEKGCCLNFCAYLASKAKNRKSHENQHAAAAGSDTNKDDKWKVQRAPRAYEEVELPDDEEDQTTDPQEQFKVVRQPHSYEEVTLPEDKSRLSPPKPEGKQLTYADLDFTKSKKKKAKKSKKKKEDKNSESLPPKPSVEYTEVTVQDTNVCVNK